MNLLTPLKIAYRALKVHKVRSALTILGLMIGVTSIIVVMNMGQGIKGFILKQVEVFGTDYVEVEIKVPSVSKTSIENAMGLAQGISVTTLKLKDAEAVAKHPNIRNYYAGQMGQEVVSYESESKTTLLWGMTASFFDLYKAKVKEGQPFTDEEDKSLARVVVIGPVLKEKLFGEAEAIGKQIKIRNRNFRVAGVIEEQGNYFGFMDMDNIVYLPIRTLQKQIMGIDHIQFIVAFMHDPAQAEATAADLTEIMRDQHNITDPKKDDFAVTTMEEAVGMLDTITGGLTLLLVAIAGISLLVGGVGIMNIMYVSVSERTFEIGLRKSVGATKANILWQFLWEAIFLTFTSGLIGVILGTAYSLVAVIVARQFGFDWGFNFSWVGLVLGVGFSVLVGLIFGLYPARKAARMEPVAALRHE